MQLSAKYGIKINFNFLGMIKADLSNIFNQNEIILVISYNEKGIFSLNKLLL